MQFTDVLIKNNAISKDDLAKLSTRAQTENVSLNDLLKEQGISSEDIAQAKAEAISVPFRRISQRKRSFGLLKQIPEEAARHYKFVPLEIKDGVLEIGMVDPENMEAREALQFIVSELNLPSKVFLISEDDLGSVLDEYKGLGGEVTQVLGELETAMPDFSADARDVNTKEIFEGEEKHKFVEEAPVTKMVAVIMKHAVAGGASDVHIEPGKDKLRVRYRVDGILHTSIVLPLNVHEAIVSRIKILTNLKLDEKRKPQDSRFEARIENRPIDFRVSTFPTFYGEKVVVRILDKEKGVKSLEEMGFGDNSLKKIRLALTRPYGLILLTGPTGSGKTTTLYAMMKELDREKNNVISLEDPVEYNIDGMSQSQVRPEIGYDFASGLRSILRQDPDMVMVGEIRDRETAALAIQTALTGHLVFSTLHTNNAAGVIPRLIDMGIDPFLIAATLELAIGQRLVRTLCPDSRKEIPIVGSVKERIDMEMAEMTDSLKSEVRVPDKIYQGVPSSGCPQGSKGRVGIFELLKMTPELENIILTNPVEPEIFKEARRQGMFTMKEDALMKVFGGFVGLEELNRL